MDGKAATFKMTMESLENDFDMQLSTEDESLTNEFNMKLSGGESMVKDYNVLYNKPKIEGVTLIDDKTFDELGMRALTNMEIDELLGGN